MKEVSVKNLNNEIPNIFFVTIALRGCPSTNSGSKNFENMKVQVLEKRLIEIGYSNLLLSENQQLDSIWQDGNNKYELEQIINVDTSSLSAKFLASEILNFYGVKPKKEYNKKLAEAYSFALSQTNIEKNCQLGLNANLWGFLYELDDSGHLGGRLISFGNAALPFLIKLLDDNGSVLYEGSREATIGNEYQYRIKDFAAFYISKIRNIPIKFYQDFEKRDKEIERMKILLETDKK